VPQRSRGSNARASRAKGYSRYPRPRRCSSISSASMSVTERSSSPARVPSPADAPARTLASVPTTSCSTQPVCLIDAGASRAARIVGAKSISWRGLRKDCLAPRKRHPGAEDAAFSAWGLAPQRIFTDPLPVKMNPPKLKVMAPVEASAVNVTGTPRFAGSFENDTAPLSVATLPATDPVRGIVQ